jgi:hypothetical protein
MQAFELQGPSKVGDASVCSIWCPVSLFCKLDLTAPEALPIVQQLEGMASTLRFLLVRRHIPCARPVLDVLRAHSRSAGLPVVAH